MHLLPSQIEEYIQQHTSEEMEVLAQLNRQTNTDVLMPQMLSGNVQGQFLQMISQLLRPSRVLEIGTYTGYSAICLAQGLAENGQLVTIDINEELEDMVRSFFDKAGLQDKIKYIIGNATEVIKKLDESWDLVFIDADKQNYSTYYHLVIDKVRSGGFVLADNVLWSGRITDVKKDKDTQKLAEFNQMVQQDSRVDNVIVSIRDGIMMIRKK
ncbi:MAG TPA: O-methyltransferase [Chitinophagales bacterium]|nr:O-methyltransferase [Chitinophagales bacterium]